MITKYIGQAGAVETLNEVLKAAKAKHSKNEPFPFRPVNLGGWTGTGKSHLAARFADELKELGYNYLEVTPNAGWRDLYRVFQQIISQDEENGAITPIPYVIFWDEFQAQKIALDILKALMTKVDEPHTIRRQGFDFHYDPTAHIHIFASNMTLDKAMQRRCLNLSLTQYSRPEMRQLATLKMKMKGLELNDEAMEALLDRVKPLAGDLEEVTTPLVNRAFGEGKKKLGGAEVTEVLKKQGYFPKGLRRSDIAIINHLAKEGPTTAAVLKFKVQDEKKRDTQEKIDWLCSNDLLLPVRGGFALSKGGKAYAEAIIAAQKKAKASK